MPCTSTHALCIHTCLVHPLKIHSHPFFYTRGRGPEAHGLASNPSNPSNPAAATPRPRGMACVCVMTCGRCTASVLLAGLAAQPLARGCIWRASMRGDLQHQCSHCRRDRTGGISLLFLLSPLVCVCVCSRACAHARVRVRASRVRDNGAWREVQTQTSKATAGAKRRAAGVAHGRCRSLQLLPLELPFQLPLLANQPPRGEAGASSRPPCCSSAPPPRSTLGPPHALILTSHVLKSTSYALIPAAYGPTGNL